MDNVQTKAYQFQSMTMPFTLQFANPAFTDSLNADLQKVIHQVHQFLDQVDATFSPFKSDSLVSQYQRGDLQNNEITNQFREVFGLAIKAQSVTDGAFTPFFKKQYDPTGIVKGWAIQRAFERFMQPLIDDGKVVAVLLNGAGDIQMSTSDQSSFTWQIGIENPTDLSQLIYRYELKNGAIATSGISKRGEHIIHRDKTAPLIQATIVANELIEADLLATTAIVMGKTKFTQFAQHHPTAGLLVDDQQVISRI